MKIFNRPKRAEKGQSLVELGFSVVVLLLILSGVIELGGMMFQYMAMRDAAQEGTVYATIYPTACNQTIERVRKSLVNADPNQVLVTVTVNGVLCSSATATDACANKEVKVTVEQPNYQITMPFLGSVLGGQSIHLTAAMTGTVIRPPCP